MVFKNERSKKQCYGLLLVFSIIFGVSLGVSSDASAVGVSTSSFDLYYLPASNMSYRWRNGILYGDSNPSVIDAHGGIQRYQFNLSPVQAGGNYLTMHFETNIVATRYNYSGTIRPWVNLPQQNILTCSANGVQVLQKNLSYATTTWQSSGDSNNTLTYYGDIVLSGFNQGTTYNIVCAVGSSSYSFLDYTSSLAVWFEQNPVYIEWSNDESIALLNTQIVQNETIINQNNIIIEGIGQTTDAINNLRSDETNASDNIENQSSSDISTGSPTTTNLFGVISQFITAISGSSVTGGNCILTLPFPVFAGGSRTVNVCNGKENLGNDFLRVFTTLVELCFFVPLCWVLIRMIYGEIRSWTNG